MLSFLEKYRPFALVTERKTGISHLFILAQAALETGWGAHAPGNMFFGIKATATTPADARQLLKTVEILPTRKATFPQVLSITALPNGTYRYVVRDWFVKYPTPEASFTAHAQLLMKNPRYRQAMKYKSDPFRLAQEIARAGYATDPNYAQKLIKILKTFMSH
ncbi:glycoside hydrolase family 73 protein [Capnocytophaga sp. G2]|jgi:Muramidase (flagellum-specific)|uniref:glycoside hydrolase family 73 protein n=1 Tax=Capnocytophaga sp. G2 TaxID=3110695 RepID=UPI002B493517|nr:glucosaminidase domain-containing protein [Capnocytophaga sp. G2]MEB3004643.1 glucosaminidase domain-containing protein [Capnocytophaga sp. G2]